MSDISFGIDLGTSTSIVSLIQNGRPQSISDPQTKTPIVPSVVALSRRGELLAGQQAIDDGLPNAKIREAKRRMGTNEIYRLGEHNLMPEDVAALVLRKIKANAEGALGIRLDRAVITVPAYFDDLPRRATERAARAAGIEPLRLVSEPVAAAMAYGIDRLDDESVLLVYDFGGGTLDVTIIDMQAGVLEVRATDGDKELGGKDLDEALMRFAAAKAGFEYPQESTRSWDALKKEAEKAKRTLSSQTAADLLVPAFASREGDVLDLDVEVTRAEFERLIERFVARSLEKIEGCLAKAGMAKSQVQRLLLVGGTCYIPRVREAVESFLGLKAESGVDPDLAVSQGAAISAGLKTGQIDAMKSVVLQDAATFRMGVGALEDVGNQEMMMFSELMPANAAIPFVRTRSYVLRSLDQEEVEFEVFQDPSGRAVFPDDAIRTGAIGVIKDIPPSTTGMPRQVDIEFRYDENHIVRVQAKVIGVERTAIVQLNTDQAGPNLLTSLGALPQSSVVDTLWEKSPLASRNAALIKRAETLLEGKPAKGEIIEAALEDLKGAVAANDADRANDARERLTDLLADV